MPESITEKKKPKVQPKVMIDDKGEETEKPKGVSFLSGALLVILVVAAIFSFSIVAIELGEIKRLVGLKESTGEEIKENDKKISNLKEEISKLISEKLSAEQKSAKASIEAEGYERTAKALKETDKAWREAVSENTFKNKNLQMENSRLTSENETLSKNLSSIKTQKSLLESQIKDLKLEKENLNKYPQLVADKKAELDKVKANKSLAKAAQEQAELTMRTLTVQISALEERKNAVLVEALKGEELAKLISREQAKLDKIKASILSAEKAMENKTRLDAQIAILEKTKNDILSEKINNEEKAKTALKEFDDALNKSSVLKGETAAKLEQKIESEARHSDLVKENSRLRSERDALSAEILKLSKDYGRWVDAVKRAKAQNQSNQ